MKQGIHRIPIDQYLADPCEAPSLNSEVANILISQSALHAKTAHPKLNPNYRKREETRFDIGIAAHALILEGIDRVAVVQADDWRSKAAQQQRDQARSNGMTPLLEKHYKSCKEMVDVAIEFMGRCELAKEIDSSEAELTCIWNEGDFWCRSRPDRWSSNRETILHYKTCEDAEPDAFSRSLPVRGYDLAAVFYERGAKALGHKRARSFFLAQEITPPHACSLVGLSETMRAVAEGKLDFALALWQGCLRSGNWPAYRDRIHYADPKPYELERWAADALARGDNKTFERMIELGAQG